MAHSPPLAVEPLSASPQPLPEVLSSTWRAAAQLALGRAQAGCEEETQSAQCRQAPNRQRESRPLRRNTVLQPMAQVVPCGATARLASPPLRLLRLPSRAQAPRLPLRGAASGGTAPQPRGSQRREALPS